MWKVRPATRDDAIELALFGCMSGAACDVCSMGGGNRHEEEVQEYIRYDALRDAEQSGPHTNYRLLVLTAPDELIAGIVAHEDYDIAVGGDAVPARRLIVAALRSDLQGTWLEDYPLASHLIGGAVRDMASAGPELIAARVALCNERSKKLLARHRFDIHLSERVPGYDDVVAVFRDVAASVPPPLAAG
jgi:hypothetical protein